MILTSLYRSSVFQSTLPRRERPLVEAKRKLADRFQSTLPRRERRWRMMQQHEIKHFNPRSREGSDDYAIDESRLPIHHFNPRSREGSDGQRRRDTQAPRHFNPRSREGSDVLPAITRASTFDFNPRSREGSDRDGFFADRSAPNISIHAPAKGATHGRMCFSVIIRISIHAPAKGATRAADA